MSDLLTAILHEVFLKYHLTPFAVIIAFVVLLLILWHWFPAAKGSAHNDASRHTQSNVSCEAAPIDALLERMGAPKEVHMEGCMVPPMGLVINNIDIFPIENELCSGKFLAMHRATHDKKLDQSGDYPFGKYFHGKKTPLGNESAAEL